ncbi:MAG: beta-N-acetylhexosaminidase [Cellulomonas sp. 73-92]|uniref:family 20 glycosylhydrolase n=1 Tax=Cellulomonas sp. 73-92 TaxID=1895740 RepID=UPI00092A69FB|nr:family 20 glycosylhydrolase [Cellulomonas sp. 73-92]OJV81595.1 MAG: beta-N-acetylhexosaminidase [Cellulomonas sp. 73-92]
MSAVLPLVPVPSSVRPTGGAPFVVTPGTAVEAPPGAESAAAVVAAALGGAAGFVVPARRAGPPDEAGRRPARGVGPLVVLVLDPTLPVDGDPGRLRETYTLAADEAGVCLAARTPEGLHRAAATLSQLLTTDGTSVVIPPVQIEDVPRYTWRGLSVDVARHFLPVADLEAIVDLLAGYKLNVLHLHLTDDQGWRLDLPSRPELAARSSAGGVDGDPGGAYSAADWSRLVAHAAARGVAVVPEIDVPGHVNAALHAVPALNPDGVAPDVYEGVAVGFSSLRSDLPETVPFLTDVFGDLAAMTPGEHLHLGGDEAHHTPPDEYVRLVGAAVAAVRATGRTVVGWQEVAAAPLPPGTVVQLWDTRADTAPVVAAARAGARVLMSPADHVYLDMQYAAGHALGQDWAGYVELRDAYAWEPAATVPGLDPAAVVGVEAAIWTETLRTRDEVMSMLLPRLAAVAEVAWSSSADWEQFRERVAPHAAAWDRDGLAWHASPQVDWRR